MHRCAKRLLAALMVGWGGWALAQAGPSGANSPAAQPAQSPSIRAMRPATTPAGKKTRREDHAALVVTEGHREGLSSFDLSANGKLAATGSQDKSIAVWEIPSGKLLKRLQGHRGRVGSVGFSPDGRLLASGGDDAVANVWETDSGEIIAQFDSHRLRVNCVAIHPDGKRLLTGCCDHLLRVWDIESETLQAKYDFHDCVQNIAIDPDGRRCYVGTASGMVVLLDLSTGQRLWEAPPEDKRGEAITSLTIIPGGNALLVSSWYDGQRSMDAATGKRIRMFHKGGGAKMASTRDGRFCIVLGRYVNFHDMQSGELVTTLVAYPDFSYAEITPDSKYLVGAGQQISVRSLNEPANGLRIYDLNAVLQTRRPLPDEE